ncbi:MAG: hypothetical protein KJO82_10200, partial [Gammaproteobacteria bacterium]|nr:hypothetical protein [Gammaproteobacteria bacterium]
MALLLIVSMAFSVGRAESEAPGGALLAPANLLLLGATVGDIQIVNDNIFDLDDPAENKALYRLANRLHSKTDAEVIARQLLFASGELFDPQKLAESERLLRKTRYIGDVDIRPVRLNDGIVDILVNTTDDWTLKPSLSFGREGGVNTAGVGVEEYNLFGRGTHIGVEFKADVDRDSLLMQFSDRNLFGSRFGLSADYANNSDGFDRRLAVEQPFYSLRSRRAGGLSLQNGRQITTLYDRGDAVAEFDHSFVRHSAWFGWSKGLTRRWTRRITSGFEFEEDRFRSLESALGERSELPTARRYAYPFIGIEIVEDDYLKTRNVDQIGRVEDRHLGAAFAMKLGFSSKTFGSSKDALHLEAAYANAWKTGLRSTVLLQSALRGRYQQQQAANVLLELGARFDLRQSERRLLHARVSATVGKNLDPENILYLGGASGLRGYPLRYLSGNKTLLFTVEQRVFTDWYPFRVFRVGGAIFFDAGRSFGPSLSAANNPGWLRNVGVGLRLGNTRSSVGRVLHLDLAMPLDGDPSLGNLQVQIEAKRS